MSHNDDFYVGYLPLPPGIRRFLLVMLPVLLLVAAIAAGVVSSRQSDPGGGKWEFGVFKQYEGVILTKPYPMLRMRCDDGSVHNMMLVLDYKAGAAEVAADFDGLHVLAQGSLLERDGRLMLELPSAETIDGTPVISKINDLGVSRETLEFVNERPKTRPLGTVRLKGEIIDPKCYLGAMKPGGGKTHKACATLCIRGGIPPMFVTRDDQNIETYYLLTNSAGAAIKEPILTFVGEPVEIHGELEQRDDLLILKVRQGGVSRL